MLRYCKIHLLFIFFIDVPVRPPQDYLTVLISDLNCEVAIIAHFMLPEFLPPDVSPTQLFSGQSGSLSSQKTGSKERCRVIDQLVTDSRSLIDKRMLFILDVYGHNGCEEMIINKAYLIDQ